MTTTLGQVFTEKDNTTLCPVRIGSGIVAFVYHAVAGVGVYMGSVHYDLSDLGQYIQHMMMLIGISGATVGVKSAMKADAANAEDK